MKNKSFMHPLSSFLAIELKYCFYQVPELCKKLRARYPTWLGILEDTGTFDV